MDFKQITEALKFSGIISKPRDSQTQIQGRNQWNGN